MSEVRSSSRGINPETSQLRIRDEMEGGREREREREGEFNNLSISSACQGLLVLDDEVKACVL